MNRLMLDSFVDEFEKIAGGDNWHHAAELAGLGVLAIPTVHEMIKKPTSEWKPQHAAELGGLSILAAPALHSMLKRR